jgi:peptide/nickel transport system substrate-binding protein/oligopeptide transport system substrate-binding protein
MMSMNLRAYYSRLIRLAVLLGALALLLVGCDLPWQAKQSDMAKDQTLKMGWNTGGGPDITTLDPAQCADPSCGPIVPMLYDGLVTIDRNEHVEPWVARSWTISADGLTYTFRLRPNQRFSDGAPVTASDYAWSIDRSANPCLGSQLSYYLATIKDASAFSGETCPDGQVQGSVTSLVDDSVIPDDSANTLTIKLAQPAGYFLQALTYSTSFAVEKSVVTGADFGKDDGWLNTLATGGTGQGGSGMFYVAAWNHQGLLTLKQNPHWWGLQAGKKPNFTTVNFQLYPSTDTEYSTYQTDQTLAYANMIPVDQIAAAKGRHDYHELPALIMTNLLLNWKIPPFDDLDARKAFCLAVNRDQINQQVFGGANLPTWHLIPQGMPGYNDHLHGLDNAPVVGNMALAQSYWQRYLAAYQGSSKPPSIQILVNGVRQQSIFMNLQARLSQLFGHPVTFATFWVPHILGSSPGWEYQVPMQLFSWLVDYPDPQDFLPLLYATGSQYNIQNVSVPTADALMRQADALPDLRQRIPLYQQAEQMLIDNVAVCPLYQTVNHYALRTWVKGDFVEDARGLFPNDAWVSGYIARH